jgi:hypothetical protein
MPIEEEEVPKMCEGQDAIATDLQEHFPIAWQGRSTHRRGVLAIKWRYQQPRRMPINGRVAIEKLLDGFGKRRLGLQFLPINRAAREHLGHAASEIKRTPAGKAVKRIEGWINGDAHTPVVVSYDSFLRRQRGVWRVQGLALSARPAFA